MAPQRNCHDCGESFDLMADGVEEVFSSSESTCTYPVGYTCPGCSN